MPQRVAEITEIVAAPPEAVWRVLTSREGMGRIFFGAAVESDFAEGGEIRFSGEWDGTSFIDKGRIVSVVPRHRLSFTHWSSLSGSEDLPENHHIVTFVLEPARVGTEVTLSQDNADGADPVSAAGRAELERNWRAVLDGLKSAAEEEARG